MLRGRAFKLGDDVDTDVIIPARYLTTSEAAALAPHCLEAVRPDLAKEAKSGDMIVAGKNFGCGSSREHAPLAIKGCGISCVIARDFARIFYRNAFNIGLPVFESAEASQAIAEGDRVEVDETTGVITNLTTGTTYRARPIPPFMQELVKAGGLMNYVAKCDTKR